jgi:alpha-glucosidase
MRALLDSYPGDRMMVGEVFLLDTNLVATYYGSNDELHLSFNFPPLFAPWDADRWRKQLEITSDALDPVGAWPTWVLSNHDVPRHRTRYGGGEARARAAAVLLLGIRGTPFLFQGEELGLTDAEVPPDRVVDPGGRDGCRAPVPWEPDAGHGWGGAEPWLPWPPAAAARSVASQRADEGSILHLYRRMLDLRRASPALRSGSQRLLDGLPPGVLGWERRAEGDRRVVLVNFGPEPATALAVTGRVQVSSDGVGEGSPFAGRLAGETAVVVEAAS